MLISMSTVAQKNEAELFQLLLQKDNDIFTVAFVTCDVSLLEPIIAEDLEFYHDKSGIDTGKDNFIESLKNGVCKNQGQTTRELLPETLKVFPLADNGKLYGAIQTGEHLFYETHMNWKKGMTITLAKFTHLWLLVDGEWKLKRVLSYDHKPVPVENFMKL